MTKPATPAIGIDLGTTFSALARIDDRGRPITVVNAEGDLLTPSVVLFDGEDVVVGKEALKAIATEADHVAECSKRDVGHHVYHKLLEGKQYPPEVIEALILNKLRVDAGKQIGPLDKAVITVPAYFDEVRRKATQDSGYMAGFEVLDIINEPTAAALAFGFQQGYLDQQGSSPAPRNILVYDLGGGTFDVTVMQIRGTEFIALATDGDVRLGGYDWDQRLVDLAAERFIGLGHADPREDPVSAGKLWRECEDAKRTLSARQKATVACQHRGESERIEIARKEFEEATQDLLDRTRFTTVQALRAAGLEWSDLERVLLVGGSTRMPMVREMLRRLSGMEPDDSVAADEAVAHGAALQASLILARQQGLPPTFKIRNVNSHSLGVVGTRSGESAASERHPHSPQHPPARHRQADLQDAEGGPTLDPRRDRRGRKPLGRRLHADRPLLGPQSAVRPAHGISGGGALSLHAERAAEGPRHNPRHRPPDGHRNHPRYRAGQGTARRLAEVHLRPSAGRAALSADAAGRERCFFRIGESITVILSAAKDLRASKPDPSLRSG